MSDRPIVIDLESAARRAMAGVVTAAFLASPTPAPAAEITSTWTGGGTTNRWVEAANWSPVGVPNNNGADTYHVVIDGDPGQDLEIVLDLAPYTIQTLTIDAGDTLTLAPPGTLNIAGGLVTVNGTMQINPANATGLARLIFPEDAQILGAGGIHMMGQPGRCLIQIGNDDTVTLGETPAPPAGNPVIHGRGVISGNALVNNSTISADQPGEVLVFYFFNALTNNGVIEGIAGSSLLGGAGTVSLDFTTVLRPTSGLLRGEVGVNASQILGGTISQANVTFYPGSPTSPQSIVDGVDIDQATITLFDQSDPAFQNTTATAVDLVIGADAAIEMVNTAWTNGTITGNDGAVADVTDASFDNVLLNRDGTTNWQIFFRMSSAWFAGCDADQVDVQVDAGCTLHVDGGSMANLTVSGDPNDATDQVELAGDVTFDATTMEHLNIVADYGLAMRLANAFVYRYCLQRIFGQLSIVPAVQGQTATVQVESSTVEAADPTAMLDSDSGIDWVWADGSGVMDIDAIVAAFTIVGGSNTSLTVHRNVSAAYVLANAFYEVKDDAKVSTHLLALLSFGVLHVEETPGGAAPPGSGGEPTTVTVDEQLTFEITDEANWSWDPGAILALAGGVGASTADYSPWMRLEVGGADLGTDPANHVGDPAGFDGNFDLPVLRIDPGAHAYLEDLVDNGNRDGAGGPAEALYVDTLEFADGAGQLNLNGLHLYYQTIAGDAAQIIDEAVASCPADLDGDGAVGITDFLALLAAWGPNPGHPADLDGDDVVGISDFLLLLADWGPCP